MIQKHIRERKTEMGGEGVMDLKVEVQAGGEEGGERDGQSKRRKNKNEAE